MAGFEVTSYGRFWVTAKEINNQIEKLIRRKELIRKLLDLFEQLDPLSVSPESSSAAVNGHADEVLAPEVAGLQGYKRWWSRNQLQARDGKFQRLAPMSGWPFPS